MIGTLQESSLHLSLKKMYAQPGDLIEAPLDGFFIDILRDLSAIEIQTGSFTSLKRKLDRLLVSYPVKILYPVPHEKWIIRMDLMTEKVLSKRKSPKKGTVYDAFRELVRIAKYLSHPNLEIEVLLTVEEEIWLNDGKGSWRRKGWSISDRRLVRIVSRYSLQLDSYLQLLPANSRESFTVRELASSVKQPRQLISKMVYCLREMGIITQIGKRGRAYLYSLR